MMDGTPLPPRVFVAVEGANAVGKSTVAAELGRFLAATVLRFPAAFLRFRAKARLDETVPASARLVYYLAAAVQLSDTARESLELGSVVCDRYLPSVFGVMMADGALAEDDVAAPFRAFQRDLLVPDLTIVLTADHATVRARIAERPASSQGSSTPRRRTEESAAYFERFAAAISRHARRQGPTEIVDTRGRSIEEVCRESRELVVRRLGLRADAGPR